MNNFKSGLVSVSFRKLTPEEIISYMREAELSYVEWGSDVHAPCDDPEKIEKIAKLQKENNIICCSYGTYFRLGETDISELEKYINTAKKLGTDILRLWCGTKGSLEYTDDEKELLFEECRRAAYIAKKNDVTLCMECHPNTMTDEKDAAYELMKSIGSENFKMYWQPNIFKTHEYNIDYIKRVKQYITHIHVYNWDNKATKHPLKEKISEWITYIKEIGGERNLLLEFMPDDRPESLKPEADALREIISGAADI